MSIQYGKFAGSKDRETFIKDSLDPKNFERQEEVTAAFIDQMRQEGHNLETGDFKKVLEDAVIRRRWLDSQIEKGKLELAVKEAIQMSEEDAESFINSIAAQEQEIEAWEVKDEEALELDAKLIMDLIQWEPRLANLVLNDKGLATTVESGLRELKMDLAVYEQRFEELDDNLHRAVLGKVDAMELPEKLEMQAAQFDQIISATLEERDALEQTLTAIRDQMANASKEAASKDQEKAKTISDLMTKLGVGEKENAELKTALSTSDSEKKSLNQHIGDLERQIKAMEVTQRDLRQSADQAQNDLVGLRKEKADQAREMATLSVQFESERSAAAQQLTQATEAHAAAIKIVRDDLSRAGQDHAVAIETVQAELASARESFKLLQEENSDFQKDYQQQRMAIETLTGEKFHLEAGLQTCQNGLHRSAEENRTAIDKLKSDLQECNDTLEQHRQASRAQLDNLSSEKTGLESSL
ncbi:MAG: hypothetical protein LQ339_005132 [Xanthoria mediterranea]|nr:MAG: hypothetical protein LQ339_005132 [Xanthoria mediterranea]